MVSDSISLPLSGYFSPFPHGTSSLSVGSTYSALEGGPPGFLQHFTCAGVLGNSTRKFESFRVRDFHPLWSGFPTGSANFRICNFRRGFTEPLKSNPTTPYKQRRVLTLIRFRLFPVRSPLLGESRLISFPEGTEMFHFPSFA